MLAKRMDGGKCRLILLYHYVPKKSNIIYPIQYILVISRLINRLGSFSLTSYTSVAIKISVKINCREKLDQTQLD